MTTPAAGSPTWELLPTRAVYAATDPVKVEVRGLPAPGVLSVLHLGEPVGPLLPVAADGTLDLGRLPAGGYGLELAAGGRVARTAVDVAADPTRRLRYGFVTDYRPHRDLSAVSDLIRRLHLTDIQCYDWAYRHADLLGGGEDYTDPLDQPISVATVRAVVTAAHQAGARALGYAAVYGVGTEEWPAWADAALLTPTGTPYALGDFLRLVDPADPAWVAHFTADLTAATDRVGFDGFHLDQYGYPKHATHPDGTPVHLEESFAAVITAARAVLPAARLVFNNVNDFPTWATARLPQDAVYIEVWPPHTTLGHLAAVVDRAHSAGGTKPVVIAAYQHVYTAAPAAQADLSAAFTMATLFSHDATHLLAGEGDRMLTDPYYPRNHTVEDSTAALLRRWYDFDVEHLDLLHHPDSHDMTGALAGTYNDDCDITYPTTAPADATGPDSSKPGSGSSDSSSPASAGAGIGVTESPTAGAVWRRIRGTGTRLVVHLINLTDQTDTDWDSPRRPVTDLPTGILRIRRAGPGLPRVRVADPDRHPTLIDLEVTTDGNHATAHTPPAYLWQVLLIDL